MKRRWIIGVAAAMLAALVAVLWFRPETMGWPTAKLPDGSTFRVTGVSYGTRHFRGSGWQRILTLLPDSLVKRTGSKTFPWERAVRRRRL